jgi:hypothetical protein
MVLTCKQYPQCCEYPNIICMDPDKTPIDIEALGQKGLSKYLQVDP